MGRPPAGRASRRISESVKSRVELVVGGPARARVVAIFAFVLALEGADAAAVGAAAPQLEVAFHISYAQLGLLTAITTLVGALVTVPVGVLADRVRRVDLLAATVALWAVAMVAGATAQSYGWLLLSRLGLGVVIAAAGPALGSLTGDFFPAAERAKIYGYILSGELLGAGFGFAVSGAVAGLLSWRAAFGVLAVPAAALAALIWRQLPEPARGGQSRLDPGAERILDETEVARRGDGPDTEAQPPPAARSGPARRAVAARHVQPISEHVLRQDPTRMRLLDAVRYVLSVRTNVWVIVATAIGYFFFAGLRTFALIFVRGQFSLSQAAATGMLVLTGTGSLIGVLLSGRLADRMIRKGTLDARMLVGAASYLLAVIVLVPAVLVTSVAVALPLYALAGASLSAPNPPLDAARLDIMPSRLWGRAEGVRTLVRQSAQAGAPLLFGILADALGGNSAMASQNKVSSATARGLGEAFLIMLLPLLLNSVFLFVARRSYAADVATAVASEQAVATEQPVRAPT